MKKILYNIADKATGTSKKTEKVLTWIFCIAIAYAIILFIVKS